jgi:hypothetical protein
MHGAAIRARYKSSFAKQGSNADQSSAKTISLREVQAGQSGIAHHASVHTVERNRTLRQAQGERHEDYYYFNSALRIFHAG